MTGDPQTGARGLAPLLIIEAAALAWAGLSLALWQAGHQPSAPSPLFGSERAYLGQAIVLPLALPLAGLASGWVLHRLARALGGTGERRATIHAAWLAQGGALGLAFIVPDTVVYTIGGFAAMQRAVIAIAPIAFATLWLTMTVTAIRTHELPRTRAILAALVAIIVLGVLIGPIAR